MANRNVCQSIAVCLVPYQRMCERFPNCLPYCTMEEQVYMFTLEAATEQLIKSFIVNKRDVMERDLRGIDKCDECTAWIHTEAGKKHGFYKSSFQKMMIPLLLEDR
eukprot:12035810-Ditylum_brightwellii.AAC.1